VKRQASPNQVCNRPATHKHVYALGSKFNRARTLGLLPLGCAPSRRRAGASGATRSSALAARGGVTGTATGFNPNATKAATTASTTAFIVSLIFL